MPTDRVGAQNQTRPTRRAFLEGVAYGAAAGTAAVSLGAVAGAYANPAAPVREAVKRRVLGRTGLRVSEVGFGGHSWSYARVPDGRGGLRKPTLEEATRMIALGLEMGVNFFDSCTPEEEHTVPGQVIKRLGKRDEIVVSARLCHKMKGVPGDRDVIYRWVDARLRLWQTDRFDILMVTNTENDTPQSGYWDMSHCLEAVEKLKRQGKIRFAGFGCHFQPHHYFDAFERFGKAWDVCSVPYNIRHRAAEAVIPAAKKAGLGMVTIKPFARGALLQGHDSAGRDAGVTRSTGLARDMIAFVLENHDVGCCICGVHTEAHVRENFSASWTRLTPAARQRLAQLAATASRAHPAWLERGWVC